MTYYFSKTLDIPFDDAVDEPRFDALSVVATPGGLVPLLVERSHLRTPSGSGPAQFADSSISLIDSNGLSAAARRFSNTSWYR